jgi:hypothetical protein
MRLRDPGNSAAVMAAGDVGGSDDSGAELLSLSRREVVVCPLWIGGIIHRVSGSCM